MVANLETSILEMIQIAKDDALAPLNATTENLAERIAACEHYQGDINEVATLRAKIASLKRK